MAKATKQSSDTLYAQLVEVSARLQDNSAALTAIERAHGSLQEALANLKQERAHETEKYKSMLNLGPLVHDGGGLRLPTTAGDSFYWAVFGDQLEDFHIEQLKALYAQLGPGLSKEEKAQQTAALRRDQDTLEVEEERLIRLIEAAGTHVVWRCGEADLKYVLDVQTDGTFDVKRANALIRDGLKVQKESQSLWEDLRDKMEMRGHLQAEERSLIYAGNMNDEETMAPHFEHLGERKRVLEENIAEIRQEIDALAHRRNDVVRLAARIERFMQERDQQEQGRVSSKKQRLRRDLPSEQIESAFMNKGNAVRNELLVQQ